jgi:hypothetical protein
MLAAFFMRNPRTWDMVGKRSSEIALAIKFVFLLIKTRRSYA